MMNGIFRRVFDHGGALCQNFFTPLFFDGVADACLGGGGFVERHEVVDEAEKSGWCGLGGDVAGPW